MRLHIDADDYFDDGEYVLADSGFTCTRNIIPMYRRLRGTTRLARETCELLAWQSCALI
jgi:hypothetical protein